MDKPSWRRRHTLVVNPTGSWCGACGQPAYLYDKKHIQRLGYDPDPAGGCGERWVFVTSDYTDFAGLYKTIQAERPDLVFVHLFQEEDSA